MTANLLGRMVQRRPRRLIAFLLLVLLLVPAPAQSVRVNDVDVRVDLHQSVDTRRMVAEDPCGGRFTPDSDGVGILYEEDDASGDQGVLGGGYTSSGCGYARLGVTLPPGASSIRVHFFADRRVDAFMFDPPGELRQGLLLRDLDTGLLVHQSEYFPSDAPSREDRMHFVGPVVVPSTLRNAGLEFYFQDVPPVGEQTGAGLGPLSGRAFSAYLHDVEVVVEGDLVGDVTVQHSDEREGTLLLDEVRVRWTVPEGSDGTERMDHFRPVPHVRVGPDFEFTSLRLPDGQVLRSARSWTGSLPDDAAVLLDRNEEALEVVVTPALVGAGGAGTYEMVLRATESVRVSPALLPVALLLLAAPLPFAALALVQARVFHREAFGAYRRAARYLMLGVVGVLAYYLFVVASAFVAGRLDLMGVWPLPLEGWLLYVQVLSAGIAFMVLWLSARAMYWITRPRPGSGPFEDEEPPEEPEPAPPRLRRRPSDPDEPDAT